MTSPHNTPIKLSVRPVTPRAVAGVRFARSAGCQAYERGKAEMASRLVITALALLAAVPMASAVGPEKPGILGGYIAVGASPEYLKDWVRPGSPTVPVVKEFHIGGTAYIGFIVTGILPDEAGQAHVTVDFRIARPDGSEMFMRKAYAKVVGPMTKETGFVIAKPALDLKFDSTDSLGTYSIVAMFHDAVSKKGALCEVLIELVK